MPSAAASASRASCALAMQQTLTTGRAGLKQGMAPIGAAVGALVAQASGAALLNGVLAHSLDFDDTHAAGSLHPAVGTRVEQAGNHGVAGAVKLVAYRLPVDVIERHLPLSRSSKARLRSTPQREPER